LDPVPSGRTVTARLMSASGWFNTGSAFHEVVTTWTTTVADNGAWTLTLPASSSYDAANTWYLPRLRCPHRQRPVPAARPRNR
jgi:hypothetical protein